MTSSTQANPDDSLWWWVRNDDSEVYVPADFYYDALKVVPCESQWNPFAAGSQGERGWFQILNDRYAQGILTRLNYTWEDMFDPGKNTEVAVEFWKERGWLPWGTCQPN